MVMARQRKSDKHRLIEGRGIGRGNDYKPFYKPHEIPSDGLSIRLPGWEIPRMYCFLSDLERKVALIAQWEGAIDIREQYPLLPLSYTQMIAKELRIRHPAIKGEDKITTSDLVITWTDEGGAYDEVVDVKPIGRLTGRVKQKFDISEEYWRRENIDWSLVTEEDINHTKAENIKYLYHSYYWAEDNNLDNQSILELTYDLKNILVKNNFEIIKSTNELDRVKGWGIGTGLSLLKYLLARKVIKTDMDKDITSFRRQPVKVWF